MAVEARAALLGAAAMLLVGAGAAAASPSQPMAIPLPADLPAVRLSTLLVGLHLVGLCFGLGATTMLDFWILRWMRWGGMPAEIGRTFHFLAKVAVVGLAMLWVSGLGFLAVYAVEEPAKLANPKIWAKVTIVAVLTLNGILLHAAVLPGVLRDVGRPVLHGLSRGRTGLFLASGAVSGVSWYAAFALGLLREFNGTVAYATILTAWAGATVLATLGAGLLWRLVSARRAAAANEAAFLQIAASPAAPPIAIEPLLDLSPPFAIGPGLPPLAFVDIGPAAATVPATEFRRAA